jgi:RNA polymerase sigma factor (sigma-70 family)
MKDKDTTQILGAAELLKAREDFRRMLRCKRFSSRWIEEHADELLSQACTEYTARFADGGQAERPVGWLVHTAWWRAQDLLEAQGRKPPISSLETAFHLADESTPSPEQQALHHDSDERLRKALGHLPEKENRLLSLIYFGEHSIREAGQKVGWRKSAADRHHNAALEKLRALLGDERTLPSPATLGLLAWLLGIPGATRKALAAGSHRLAELWRRVSPLTDPAGAAATGGGGRVLGACGVAAATVLCGVAASGVVPALHGAPPHRAPSAAKASRVEPVAGQAFEGEPLLESETPRPAPAPRSAQGGKSPTVTVRPAGRAQPTRRQAQHTAASAATTAQTVNEFGVEASPAPASPATVTPEGSVSAGSSPALPSARPAPSSGGAGSPESPAAAHEFGL